jgi:transposase
MPKKPKKQEKHGPGPGRPSKLSEALIKEICEYVRKGNYIETAAAAAGISKQTLYAWMKAGAREEDPLAVEFLDAYKKADAEAEAANVQLIRTQARKNWQAAAWFLERKHPDKWGRKDRLTANVNHSGNVDKHEEIVVKQQIQADPETIELISELYDRRKRLINP